MFCYIAKLMELLKECLDHTNVGCRLRRCAIVRVLNGGELCGGGMVES